MSEDKSCRCEQITVPEWKESICDECAWGYQIDTVDGIIIVCRRTNVTVRENCSACPAFVKK